jgi:GNAT superfamily N-acetyltransferase
MQSVTIRTARLQDSTGIARLFVRFGDFQRAFGAKQDAGVRILATDLAHMDFSSMLVAEEGGRLVGAFQLVDDLEAHRRSQTGAAIGHYFAELGVCGTGRALACLVLGSRAARPLAFPNATFMNLLIVAEHWQGNGIGRSLLMAACERAHAHGRNHLTGWVNTSNHQIWKLFGSLFGRPHVEQYRYSVLSHMLLGVPRWAFVVLDVSVPLASRAIAQG